MKFTIRFLLSIFIVILGLSIFSGCNDTVSVTSVTLNKSELSIQVGENETLTATVLPDNASVKTVTWTSSNEGVATVSQGNVVANSVGTAIITVSTTDGNKTATCTVSVTENHIHSFTEQDAQIEYLASSATCSAKARYYYSCSCGEKSENTFEHGDVVAHSFTQYVSDGNATTTADGTKTAECDYGCEETHTIEDVGSMLYLPAQYKVEYYLQNLADDNYTKESTENKIGNTDTTANAEIKNYEHFTYNASASTISGKILANGNLILKVYYTRDKYEVVFVANGGSQTSGSATQSVKYEGSAIAPTYIRTGYTFDGFDKEYANISQDIEVTAQWTVNEYTVTLNVNGGEALASTVKQIEYDSNFTLSVPIRANCDFMGWYNGDVQITDESGESLSKWAYADDVTLKAKWELSEGANISTYFRIDDKIYFGKYPQSEVTDEALITTLNSLVGTLPNSSDPQGWISYGYYIEGSVQDYMWYVDVISGTEKYRGVYFTSYRPYSVVATSNTDNSLQDNNGYSVGTVYWFKYEPVCWSILDESNGLIICDTMIDAQQFDVSSNNYANSSIRAWLNDNFYNTAFTTLQKDTIKTTTVDNSARSTNSYSNSTVWNNGVNNYACENTQDKIFLLSVKEVTNNRYGFNASTSKYDTVRRRKPTDYAKSQGGWTSTDTSYLGNGIWWLRSPYFNEGGSWLVKEYGAPVAYAAVKITRFGIVPALQIQMQ